jgi:hypothetical protein
VVDFEEIKDRITIRDILQECGYHPKKNRMACPIHNGENPTSFSFNDHVFYCHSCGASGGLLDLVEALLGVNRKEALRYLAHIAGVQPKGGYSGKSRKNAAPYCRRCFRNSIDTALLDLQITLKALEILRDHYTWQIRNAGKSLRKRLIEPSEYYSIIQYADYVLEELDTEVMRTNYEINLRKKEIRRTK